MSSQQEQRWCETQIAEQLQIAVGFSCVEGVCARLFMWCEGSGSAVIEIVGGEGEVGRSAVMSLRSKRRNWEILGIVK